jgi:hypothetical protein
MKDLSLAFLVRLGLQLWFEGFFFGFFIEHPLFL